MFAAADRLEQSQLQKSRESTITLTGFIFRYRKSRPRNSGLWVRYNCQVGLQPCANRAEWRLLKGKAAVRLSSYYQLRCDYGTAVMISWEKGGIAPIYLCESHATEVGRSGKNCEGISAVTPQLPSNHPAEQPKSSVPSGSPADAQVGLGGKDLAVVPVPVPNLTSGDSAKVLQDEPIGKIAREDFEAYGTVLQRVKHSTATEQKQAESAGLERLCVSRYGERCTCEATVHCPKCGRWFCDAHAEDEKWHHCALSS